MKPILILSCAAVALGSPSFAQQAPAAKPAVTKPVKEKKICRREVPTGSIMAVSTCRTQKEWNELTASGQEGLRQLNDRGGLGAVSQ